VRGRKKVSGGKGLGRKRQPEWDRYGPVKKKEGQRNEKTSKKKKKRESGCHSKGNRGETFK